jgi:predicted PurR-regulated permease PerM
MKRISETIWRAGRCWKGWQEKIKKNKEERKQIPYPSQGKEEKIHKEEKEEAVVFEISSATVFKAALIVIGVIALRDIAFELADILITFLIALFLSAVFNPTVDYLERWIPSRGFTIIFLFFLVFGLLAFIIGSITPIVAGQLTGVAQEIEQWIRGVASGSTVPNNFLIEKIYTFLGNAFAQINSEKVIAAISANIEGITNNLGEFTEKGFQIVSSTIGAVFNFILIILLTFFLVLDKNNLNDFFHSLFPQRHQVYLTEKMQLVQKKIGEWVHGQVILFFIVGGIAYITFLFIGVPYALALAMVFGLAEFVPYLGPAFSFLISAPVAFNESLPTGIGLIIFYVVLQFLEGNIIVPYVMKKAVGLPPIVTLLALIVGASFPGIINPVLGMILAVPVATIISIFVRDFTDRHHEKNCPPKEKVSKSSRLFK